MLAKATKCNIISSNPGKKLTEKYVMVHKKKVRKNIPHDGLVKKIMENPITAKEFFDEYLPIEFREKIDLLTVKLEKESFVEPTLRKQLSDVVLSVETKDNKKAFVYILLEAQIFMNEGLSTSAHPILEKTAINMLKEKIDLGYISSVTGLSKEDLLKLKSKI